MSNSSPETNSGESNAIPRPAPTSPLADIIESLGRANDSSHVSARKAIQESEQRFASFMNHLPGFAWIKDAEGKYLYANRIWELVPQDMRSKGYLGKTDADLFPADIAAEYRANDCHVIQTGEALQRVESLVWNGGRRLVLSSKFPIFDERGKTALVGGIAFDITKHLETERELKESHAQLRALTGKMQSAREEEARRIAREIHDQFGEKLTALNIECEAMQAALEKMQPSEVQLEMLRRLETMYQTIEETIGRVQRISSELRPSLLDDLGLLAALECHVREFESRTTIRCVWERKPASLELSGEPATAVFRIFQEILTNVTRHAAASETRINLTSEGGWVKMVVTDNGKGITAGDIRNPKSLGLLGMRERAFLSGGTVEIGPSPNGGTMVRLELPLK